MNPVEIKTLGQFILSFPENQRVKLGDLEMRNQLNSQGSFY